MAAKLSMLKLHWQMENQATLGWCQKHTFGINQTMLDVGKIANCQSIAQIDNVSKIQDAVCERTFHHGNIHK